MKKKLKIKLPNPDPNEGKAIVRIVEKLSPKEKKDANKSRDSANQNPAG